MIETENKEVHLHPSGIQYYEIKLTNAEGEGLNIRLFESTSNGRLKFGGEDDESYDEYTIRRGYMKKLEKQQKGGTLVWNNKWGSMNMENALKVQEELSKENKIH
tara:strand:+ start:210 stop:524 length:315 start_codon:yes stop_codon:yes gene_type:complete